MIYFFSGYFLQDVPSYRGIFNEYILKCIINKNGASVKYDLIK